MNPSSAALAPIESLESSVDGYPRANPSSIAVDTTRVTLGRSNCDQVPTISSTDAPRLGPHPRDVVRGVRLPRSRGSYPGKPRSCVVERRNLEIVSVHRQNASMNGSSF
jgi:hypothetical protein